MSRTEEGYRVWREMLEDRGEILPPLPGDKWLVRVQAHPNSKYMNVFSNFGPCILMAAADIFSVRSPCCGAGLFIGSVPAPWECQLCNRTFTTASEYDHASRPEYLAQYFPVLMDPAWDPLLKAMAIQAFMGVVHDALRADRTAGLDHVEEIPSIPCG